jgi:hypothetical protein
VAERRLQPKSVPELAVKSTNGTFIHRFVDSWRLEGAGREGRYKVGKGREQVNEIVAHSQIWLCKRVFAGRQTDCEWPLADTRPWRRPLVVQTDYE